MKKYLPLLLILFTTGAFAMPCPTGANFELGASMDAVLKQCGQPDNQVSYATPVEQRFEYYKPHSYDNVRTKIVVSFRNGLVTNIAVSGDRICSVQTQTTFGQIANIPTTCTDAGEINQSTTSDCGLPISTGNSAAQVIAACGQPNSKLNAQTETVQVTKMRFGTVTPNVWVFEDGVLSDFSSDVTMA